MSLRRAKTIFMPKNINYITIIISLKGNIRHKNIKIDCKQSNSRLTFTSSFCKRFCHDMNGFLCFWERIPAHLF